MAYAPTSPFNVSSSNVLGQLVDNYLIRRALDALRPVFVFDQIGMPEDIPAGEGKTVTWFRRTNMPAASTTGIQEGIVGTSLATPPVKTVSATISQYADFANLSDIMLKTAPDAQMAALSDELGYRAGLTLDNVARGVIDAGTGAAGTALSTYLTARDFEAQASILAGSNVLPMESGWYECYTHPYTAFDVLNDPSAGSLRDLQKYTNNLVDVKTDRDVLGTFGGCKIRKTTQVTKTAGTPNQWRTYIFGRGAFGKTSLKGMSPSQVYDPNKQTFKVFASTFDTPSVANPTGQIGGVVSYNFTAAYALLEGPSGIGGTYRNSFIDTASSIVA